MKNSFFLVIPTQQDDPVSVKLYTESAVQQWVAELPIANLAHSARALYDFIRKSNELLMPVQQRMEVLEGLRHSYLIIEDNMRSRLIKTGFPKSENEHKIYHVLINIEREYAIAYWIIVREQTRRQLSWFQGKEVALAVQRVIKGLSSVVVTHYIMSLPIPEWVWIDLHSLYKLGLKIKKESTKVADESCLVTRSSSIQESYQQIILLSLAEPRGLMPREIPQVYVFTEVLSGLIAFNKQPIVGVERQCMIYQDEDREAAFDKQQNKEQEGGVLFIDFSQLNKVFLQKKENLQDKIDGRYSTIKISQSPGKLPEDLLTYLIVRWQGVHLQGAPLFKDRLNRYFCIGLNSAYDLQSTVDKSELDSDQEYIAESASERALTCNFEMPGMLSIGSFISVRKNNQLRHKRLIGVVNKVSMQKGTNKVKFELELLTEHAYTASYRHIDDLSNDEKKLQKALIYGVKTANAPEKSYLIVESFMLKEMSIVRLYLNNQNFPIILLERKNIGLGYWQFACRQLEEEDVVPKTQELASKSNKGYDFT